MTPTDPRKQAQSRIAQLGERALWSLTPAARALLDQCVSADIRPVVKFVTYAITRDEWREYEGPLADELAAIRDSYIEAAMNGGNREDFNRQYDMKVVDAIDAAFNAAALRSMLLDEPEAQRRAA